jgi:hypothetical protein
MMKMVDTVDSLIAAVTQFAWNWELLTNHGSMRLCSDDCKFMIAIFQAFCSAIAIHLSVVAFDPSLRFCYY